MQEFSYRSYDYNRIVLVEPSWSSPRLRVAYLQDHLSWIGDEEVGRALLPLVEAAATKDGLVIGQASTFKENSKW